jgi:hypothetical protein
VQTILGGQTFFTYHFLLLLNKIVENSVKYNGKLLQYILQIPLPPPPKQNCGKFSEI